MVKLQITLDEATDLPELVFTYNTGEPLGLQEKVFRRFVELAQETETTLNELDEEIEVLTNRVIATTVINANGTTTVSFTIIDNV